MKNIFILNFVRSTIVFFLFISIALISIARAETLYVTDRILLGMHQEANETSPVIKTITSGTATVVLERNESFIKIKLTDGTEGWVSKNFLKKEKPATAALDVISVKLKKEQQNSKKLVDELASKEREIQIHRDELSNAKSSIKDLNNALKETGKTPEPTGNPEDLTKALATIKTLEEKIAQLEQEKTEVASTSGNEAVIELEKMQNQNKQFQVRIAAALANLSGETVPTAEELAAIRPSFPLWYWLLLVALLIAGIAGGVIWMDIVHRKKHGGFRL